MAKQTDSKDVMEESASVEHGKDLARKLRIAVGNSFQYDLDHIQSLLRQGADPNHTMFWGEENKYLSGPPLHTACYNGHLPVVKTLIEHGADKDVRDIDGLTPLDYACSGGRKDVVKYFLEDLKCDVDVRGNDELTPLERVYDPDVFLYLLNRGYSFDDKHKAHVLRLACRHGMLDQVKELVEQHHLNPNHSVQIDRGGEEKTALDSTIENIDNFVSCFEVALYLINRGYGDDQQKAELLCAACRHGRFDVVKELVEQHHINPNEVKSARDNWTPLHHACSSIPNKELVEYLVEKVNCDVNVTDGKGKTPLKLARANRVTDIVDYLKTQKTVAGRKRASKSSDVEKTASKKQKQETVADRKRSFKSSDVMKPASKKQKQDHGSQRTPQRECPNCGDSCRIRCKSCPHCEHQFQSSAKKQAKPNDEPKKRTRKK